MDASNALLRNMSPFALKILPSLLYLDNPDVLTGRETGTVQMGINDPAIYGTAAQQNSNFESFMGAVNNYGKGSVEASDGSILHGASSFSKTNSGSAFDSPSGAISKGGRSTTKEEKIEPAITDYDIAESMALQMDTILAAPALVMYINPTSFATTYAKKHQFTERTRYGYIYQAWGEEQIRISVSGRVGCFVAGAGLNTTVAYPTGVQFASKKASASFQQLMALFHMYKNNGYIYDVLGKSEAHLMVGVIALEYDGFVYMGNMESFEWGYEEAQQNGGLEYNFNFVVARKYDYNTNNTLAVTPLTSPVFSPSDPKFGSNTQAPAIPNSISANTPIPVDPTDPTSQGYRPPDFVGEDTTSQPWSTTRTSNSSGNASKSAGENNLGSKVLATSEDVTEVQPSTGIIFDSSLGRGR